MHNGILFLWAVQIVIGIQRTLAIGFTGSWCSLVSKQAANLFQCLVRGLREEEVDPEETDGA